MEGKSSSSSSSFELDSLGTSSERSQSLGTTIWAVTHTLGMHGGVQERRTSGCRRREGMLTLEICRVLALLADVPRDTSQAPRTHTTAWESYRRSTHALHAPTRTAGARSGRLSERQKLTSPPSLPHSSFLPVRSSPTRIARFPAQEAMRQRTRKGEVLPQGRP